MAEEIEVIRYGLRVARENGYSDLELRHDKLKFSARLGAGHAVAGEPPLRGHSETLPEHGLVAITSPVVGYYREGSEPLEVGKRIEKGAVVALVAALGLANDVEATVRGEVVEVLVEPNQPVEYGQKLAMVQAS